MLVGEWTPIFHYFSQKKDDCGDHPCYYTHTWDHICGCASVCLLELDISLGVDKDFYQRSQSRRKTAALDKQRCDHIKIQSAEWEHKNSSEMPSVTIAFNYPLYLGGQKLTRSHLSRCTISQRLAQQPPNTGRQSLQAVQMIKTNTHILKTTPIWLNPKLNTC